MLDTSSLTSQRVRSVYRSLLSTRFFSVVSAEEPCQECVASKGKVVVGGGTGFVGGEVCALLQRKGYQVVVISRTGGHNDPQRMTWQRLQQEGLPQGTKAVVNVTGHNILDKFKRFNDNFKTLVHDSRILPAKMLREAVVKADVAPNAFVQVTGAGYYPFDRPEEITEDFKFGTNSEVGYFTRLVQDWEDAATLPVDHPTRNVFIRAGVVLGRNSGMIKELYPPFFLGLGGVIGSGTQFMPWIHVKDLAGLILHSIEKPEVKGVVNGVAPELTTNAEFVSAFGSPLGRPTFIPVPEFVFNLVFGEERAALVLKSQKIVPAKALATGYKFRFPTIVDACKEFSPLFYQDPDIVDAH